MNTLTDSQRLQLAFEKLNSEARHNRLLLPQPPALFQKISELATHEHEDVSLDAIVDCIGVDPVISDKLLNIVNSALFRHRLEITSFKAAVQHLGLSRVQSLIAGLTLSGFIPEPGQSDLTRYYQQVRKRSAFVVAISYVLSFHKSAIDPEKALLAGMVHNIGAIPLLIRLNHIKILASRPWLYEQAVHEVIPRLYPYAGRILMEHWHMPWEIVSVATAHHNPNHPTGEILNLDDVVFIAHKVSLLKNYPAPETPPPRLLESNSFKLCWKDWPTACEELTEWYPEINRINEQIRQ